MSYTDAIDYLYGLQKYGIKLGIDKPEKILSALGSPHRDFLSIHVAGTNGKGSVSAMAASILMAHGFKVGLFTSPHLVSFTERIRINNNLITESEVAALTQEIKSRLKGLRPEIPEPTFFEFVTAMAFLYFQRNTVDWVVVETGMGGRLDATNIIVPEVSVLTRIGYDHKEFLGSTLADIAREKAGIIKKGVPVVCAKQEKEAEDVIQATAADKAAPLLVYGKDFNGTMEASGLEGVTFCYHNGSQSLGGLHTPLKGEHQLENSCLAIKAAMLALKGSNKLIVTSNSNDSNELQVTSNELKTNDKDSSPSSDPLLVTRYSSLVTKEVTRHSLLKKGLASTKWRGRLDLVSDSPRIMIDGAHNPDAASALAAFIRDHLSGDKIILIVGIMADKDIAGILGPLVPLALHVIFTAPDYGRAAPPQKLAELSSTSAISNAHQAPALKEAIESAKKIYADITKDRASALILITGSFYTIGEAMEILGERAILGDLRESL